MPRKARVPCRYIGCPALIEVGARTCEKHKAATHQADRNARGSAHERGYTFQWNQYRNMYLRSNPLCVVCNRAAELVDHIVPLAQGGSMYDEGNHQAMCRSCHQEKTEREKKT
jgi:5-methylcytosine-specific restriction protein A